MTAIPKEYESRDAAIADCVHCEHCNLSGLVTLFRRGYTGEPTMEIRNHNGELRKAPARIMAHCICPVGRWVRGNVPNDMLPRYPDMHLVVQGKMPDWSLADPTMPDFDPLEEPDWKALRAQLAAEPPSKIIHVNPEKTPFRAQAYREMGEPVPTVQEQHHVKST